ncbi:hydantoinase B/oxoprolinase family protein [Paenarthrobacter aromaticivorans]|uniref:Hydantoinase B/oxoprolinase family protein n=1 Tax=Paenarthrobacter aromaticivorans TaxID=2849150 RepID=A0ABS6I8M1_9MICC|nr:hydantoinase B/oxoprolinase family protein [Paenarthrobacter sp. MMS21-TAE1-1]MBU8867775.1 hydantoinase B/oxoprolinase family protein [Paenarthrobacter sp. MMS21-TAE1-1]
MIRERLEQIADEMNTVFERMAFSPVLSDAWDRADRIYSATDGSMIVQGIRGLPIFVGTMQYMLASVLNIAKEPRPWDTCLVNDPFAGGTHIMDTKLVRPYFYKRYCKPIPGCPTTSWTMSKPLHCGSAMNASRSCSTNTDQNSSPMSLTSSGNALPSNAQLYP